MSRCRADRRRFSVPGGADPPGSASRHHLVARQAPAVAQLPVTVRRAPQAPGLARTPRKNQDHSARTVLLRAPDHLSNLLRRLPGDVDPAWVALARDLYAHERVEGMLVDAVVARTSAGCPAPKLPTCCCRARTAGCSTTGSCGGTSSAATARTRVTTPSAQIPHHPRHRGGVRDGVGPGDTARGVQGRLEGGRTSHVSVTASGDAGWTADHRRGGGLVMHVEHSVARRRPVFMLADRQGHRSPASRHHRRYLDLGSRQRGSQP